MFVIIILSIELSNVKEREWGITGKQIKMAYLQQEKSTDLSLYINPKDKTIPKQQVGIEYPKILAYNLSLAFNIKAIERISSDTERNILILTTLK